MMNSDGYYVYPYCKAQNKEWKTLDKERFKRHLLRVHTSEMDALAKKYRMSRGWAAGMTAAFSHYSSQ